MTRSDIRFDTHTETQVVFEEWPARLGRVGVVRLNRPRALNALTLEMVRELANRLASWERDPEIAVVVIHSDSERAFCAGGDVKTVVMKAVAGDTEYAAEFFRWEYKTDYLIRTFAKPVLSWGDGIVMGGGLGVFCGSSHAIATERSTLAMPEITIGFFPDVGAGYFLNRMREGVGLFLGWTAARLNAWDARHLGLAREVLASSSKDALFSRLRDIAWSGDAERDKRTLDEALQPFRASIPESAAPSNLAIVEDRIVDALAGRSATEARARLLGLEFDQPSMASWWTACRSAFLAGSPLSAHIIYEQLPRARGLDVLDVFAMEWSLARRMCDGTEFREGVRALLIDKDQRPRWQPANFEGVDSAVVQTHFEPYPGESEIRRFFLAR